MTAVADITQGQLTGSSTVDTVYTSAATNKAGVSATFVNLTGGSTNLILFVNGAAEANQITDIIALADGDTYVATGILGPTDTLRASSSSASTPVNWTCTELED